MKTFLKLLLAAMMVDGVCVGLLQMVVSRSGPWGFQHSLEHA